MKSDSKNSPFSIPHSLFSGSAGFTLLELLISIVVGLILATVATLNIIGYVQRQNLNLDAESITAVLRSAQEKSMGQDNGSRWGVYFDQPVNGTGYYSLVEIDEALIASSSYSAIPGTAADQNRLRSGIIFSQPEAGSAKTIAFEKITGLPNSSTTITLTRNLNEETTNTIFVSGNGKIDHE